MNTKFFIFHPSQIIQKGLSTILKEYFLFEIISITEMEEFDLFSFTDDEFIILLGDIEWCMSERVFTRIKSYPGIKIIGISPSSESKPVYPDLDHTINLFSTPGEIYTKIVSCTGELEGNTYNPEDEELTSREKEVLKLVATGHSNKMIADLLFISIHTVISHRKNITKKLGIKSISGLTVYAIINNLIDTSGINPDDLI